MKTLYLTIIVVLTLTILTGIHVAFAIISPLTISTSSVGGTYSTVQSIRFTTSDLSTYTVTPLTVSGLDKFGVKMLYSTITGGKEWYSKWDNGIPRIFTGVDPLDPWFDANHGNATYSIDGNGLFKISGPVPRMYIHDPTLNVANSWHDVEMTVYAMRVTDNNTAYAGIEAVARTNHGTTGPELRNLCDTRGDGGRLRYDGHSDFEKETSHPNWTPVANKLIFSGGLPKNIWIGMKLVIYDTTDGNVKLELWYDDSDGLNGGNWKKINEFTDTGANFGVGGTACKTGIDPVLKLTNSDNRAGSESDKPNITVYWRSDNVGTNGLIYKKMSVREISAPSSQQQSSLYIPNWVRNSTGWWSNGKISDSGFIKGIQYLIQQGIMKIPPSTQQGNVTSQYIPNWVRDNANWWSQNQISDSDFVNGIEYLIEKGVIRLGVQ